MQEPEDTAAAAQRMEAHPVLDSCRHFLYERLNLNLCGVRRFAGPP